MVDYECIKLIHIHMHRKPVSGCMLLLYDIAEGMFTNQVVEVDFTDRSGLTTHKTRYPGFTYSVLCQCYICIAFLHNFKFYSFKETCCMFWPNEMNKSIDFAHIKVNHDSTISKTGYEVTRVDAFEKGIVSLC